MSDRTSSTSFDDSSDMPPSGKQQLQEHSRRLSTALRDRAFGLGDDKKDLLAEQVNTFASKLESLKDRGNGSEPGLGDQVVGRVVELLESFGRTLEENSTEELLHKAEQQIKARPGLFIAGIAALGFLAARLVRR